MTTPPLFRFSLTCVMLGALAAPAGAADIVGPARVIDGGTIAIGSDVVRLADIDAPAPGQACERAGQRYDCGQQAAWALAARLEWHWVTCLPRDAAPGTEVPAVCFLKGPAIDINGHMVREGWALAVGERYAAEQAEARRERRGMWAGAFVAPREWREGRR